MQPRRPKVGAWYRTTLQNYLILSVDRRGLSPRVTFFNMRSRRKTTIRWDLFLKRGPELVQELL